MNLKRVKIKSFFKLITLFMSFLVIYSCDDSKICTKNDISIMKECLNNDILQKWSGANYIVYPYFVEFGINKNFKAKLNKEERDTYEKVLFKKIDYSKASFQKIKERTNELYRGEYCGKMGQLSTANSSTRIICFSGISENLLFVNIYNYLVYPLSKIPKNYDFTQKTISNKASFVIILDNNGNVKDVEYVFYSAGL